MYEFCFSVELIFLVRVNGLVLLRSRIMLLSTFLYIFKGEIIVYKRRSGINIYSHI